MGSSVPNWSQWLKSVWGWPDDVYGVVPDGSNIIVGANPAYALQDFFALFPKYGGVPLVYQGTFTDNSTQITLSSSTGLSIGNPLAGAGIPDGATIIAINGLVVTISSPTTADGSGGVSLTFWNLPPIPFAVQLAYIAFATASLVQARWQDSWTVAVGLFVAHYLTLWAKSDGDLTSTVSQIAAQGLSNGVQVSKSVGDVSVGYSPVTGLESWAGWNLTSYGQQLATLAKIAGAGPVLLY